MSPELSYAARVLDRSRVVVPVARSGGAAATLGAFSLSAAVAGANMLLQIDKVSLTNPNAAFMRVNFHIGYLNGGGGFAGSFTQTGRYNFLSMAPRRAEQEADRTSEIYNGTRAGSQYGRVFLGVDVPPNETVFVRMPWEDGLQLIGTAQAGYGALIVAGSANNTELVCAFFGRESALPQSFE